MTTGANIETIHHEHLAAEVQQMDVFVRAMAQAALRSGKTPEDRFQGLYISPDDIEKLIYPAQPGESDSESPDSTPGGLSLSEELDNLAAYSREIEERAAQLGVIPRLTHLRKTFGLTDFEYQAFMLCLLPSLDLGYERIYGFLQDDVTQKQAGVNLILDLLSEASPGFTHLKPLTYFCATGTLVKYHLIRPKNTHTAWLEPRLDQHFEVPPAVVAWLLGEYFPEESWLKLHATPDVQAEIGENAFAGQFELDWKKVDEHRPLLSFYGPDDERRRSAARKVAAHFERPLLEIDLREACGSEPFSSAMLRLLIRDACLLDAVTYIQGWEKVLDEHTYVPAALLEEMADFGGIFILGSQAVWRVSEKCGRPVFQVKFALPSSAERFTLWQTALQDLDGISEQSMRNLAAQFTMTSGQIDNAVFTVFNRSFQADQAVTEEGLFHAARQQSSHNLGKLAQKIEHRYTWKDIILPTDEMDLLRDLVSMVRNRALVLEEWGLNKKLTSSAGVAALFTGDPGTGKTLSAQVIASELQLDLYRIDLSTVVSKYIGETEKKTSRRSSPRQSAATPSCSSTKPTPSLANAPR
ncbi:MAG TPA: AAA family ATPase [Anaerolineaceae bacterium]|nr:AAA family ATPase [Anaerolineaceae bacterium]